ncbi:uncharacterized protein, partial [Nicotiana tomentosiformis]|uniref:uncharacterized protein n=1 Tax=Nicotiana tomentosiformis TaxID=4098 RepID=UPI00388C645C
MGKGMARPASSVATTSTMPPPARDTITPAGRGTARGGIQSSGGPYKFYAMRRRQRFEASPDAVTGILTVRSHDVYVLIDPGSTLSYVTSYVTIEVGIETKQLYESFSVSTLRTSIISNGKQPSVEILLESLFSSPGGLDAYPSQYDFHVHLDHTSIGGDGTLRYQGRLCVPSVAGLREKIMIEIHQSRYSIHPGSTKMYHDVKEQYWWDNMKKSIAEFVAQCPNCQQVKIDGQAERTIQMLEDMLRACVLDFKGNWDDHLALIEFAYNNSYHSSIKMAPYEALYGRRCRSPVGWFEVGETELYGPDLIHQAIEKVKVIQERLRTAQSRQKSYSDVRRRDLEFEVGDWVFLKISPMKGVMRFGKKGKLSPRYIGPKCIGDPSRVVPIKDVQVTKDLSYDEVPVAILDRQVRKLRTKDVASVKVLWRNKNIEEMTWEAEEEMKSKYPY